MTNVFFILFNRISFDVAAIAHPIPCFDMPVFSWAFITCGKKKTPLDNIQLCEHHFSRGNVSFEITYNKRLLSDWSLIKENVLKMHRSFKSSYEAGVYLGKFLSLGEVGHGQ